MRMRPLKSQAALACLALVALAGCASSGNTLAQDLAYERWQKCSTYATVQLKEIRPDGQMILWKSVSGGGGDWQNFNQCLRDAGAEQARRGVAVVAPPAPLQQSPA